jgi:D-beta-D-heptose 7-phosphate kinase / D-beta-D-heptose 1-phosphate adenosyltransferase
MAPEAPVPVINVAPPDEVIGGAGNVARNIAALGARCDLVAVVGRDEAAQCIHRHLAGYTGIDLGLVEAASRVTTVKTRFLAYLHNTHLLSADTEETAPVDADIEDAIITMVESRLQMGALCADAVILSDYAKGVLTPRVIAAVISAAQRTRKPVIVDPKGGGYSRYRGATVLTPNVRELAQALERPVRNDEKSVRSAAEALVETIGCDSVLVTRGERALLIVGRDGDAAAFDATARRVVDVSGAGDTVVASFALALVCDAGNANSARLANSAAGIVVASAEAVLRLVARAGVVGRDPGGAGQPGAQHIARFGAQAIVAVIEQADHLALGDADAERAQQREEPRRRHLPLMVDRKARSWCLGPRRDNT